MLIYYFSKFIRIKIYPENKIIVEHVFTNGKEKTFVDANWEDFEKVLSERIKGKITESDDDGISVRHIDTVCYHLIKPGPEIILLLKGNYKEKLNGVFKRALGDKFESTMTKPKTTNGLIDMIGELIKKSREPGGSIKN